MNTAFQRNVRIGNRSVGENSPVYVIAEIGINFNGSLDLAKETIEAAKDCAVDAVKFQTFRAEEFLAEKELSHTYKTSDGTLVTESQYELFKRVELKDEWHKVLKDFSESSDLDFFSSAADVRSAKLLESIGCPAIKVASEDLINVALLEEMAALKSPLILSTGMASEWEIENALALLRTRGKFNIVVLHCVSSYPTAPEHAHLKRVSALKGKYTMPIGYSDHTQGSRAAVGAVCLGACMIEKHFTLDKSLSGPDHAFSADPKEMRNLVEQVREMELMLGEYSLDYSPVEEAGRRDFRRSIVAAEDLEEGCLLELAHLAYKRPGSGLKPYERNSLIGRQLKKPVSKNQIILLDDVK